MASSKGLRGLVDVGLFSSKVAIFSSETERQFGILIIIKQFLFVFHFKVYFTYHPPFEMKMKFGLAESMKF